jgi:nicotinamidase-related amidase
MRRACRKQFALIAPSVMAYMATVIALLWNPTTPFGNVDRAETPARKIRLELRQRHPSGKAFASAADVDVNKTAVVVVDMWTSHYCRAATAATTALVPKMNRALDAARNLGMQVILAPSGYDLKIWEGKPQRLGITSLPYYPLPKSNGFMAGVGPNGPYSAPCMDKVMEVKPGTNEPVFHCKRTRENFNLNPSLVVGSQDLFIGAGQYRPGKKSAIDSWGEPAQQELWNFVHAKGITTLIYMGVATNMCVINREFGMIEMRRLGLRTILVRDLTAAMTYNGYNPITKKLDPQWTPAVGTQYAIRYIEENIGPSITSDQLIRAAQASLRPQ